MKTLNKLFSILFLTLAIVTFTGCGDESEDPTPVKPIYQSYWKFKQAVVTPLSGGAYTVNALDCVSPKTPAFRVEYDIISDTQAIQKSPCFSDAQQTYTTKFVDGKLVEVIFNDNGSTKYFDQIVIDELAGTLTANQQTFGTAKSILITFQLL